MRQTKTALITGIAGQDGYYLTKLLKSKGYHVVGLVSNRGNLDRIQSMSIFNDTEIRTVDYRERENISEILRYFQPDEIYNLVAASSVGMSFKQPFETSQLTALVPVTILESIKSSPLLRETRFYQASSSEMFGSSKNAQPNNEASPFVPASPYAFSKLFAHQMCNLYRNAYQIFISCGILFNHESPMRSEQFVSRKISRGVAMIANGKLDRIELGDVDIRRDWGFAGDYVNAMWMMLQQDEPGDFVIATGRSNSLREFVQQALLHAHLKGDVTDYVKLTDELKRPSEINVNFGDYSKAKAKLGWQPEITFSELIKMMVDYDMAIESK